MDGRLERTRGIGQSFDGLADDLDIADDGVLGLAIGEERFVAVGGVFEDCVDRRESVEQVDAFVLHNATASA
jgi:hypothetical protein